MVKLLLVFFILVPGLAYAVVAYLVPIAASLFLAATAVAHFSASAASPPSFNVANIFGSNVTTISTPSTYAGYDSSGTLQSGSFTTSFYPPEMGAELAASRLKSELSSAGLDSATVSSLVPLDTSLLDTSFLNNGFVSPYAGLAASPTYGFFGPLDLGEGISTSAYKVNYFYFGGAVTTISVSWGTNPSVDVNNYSIVNKFSSVDAVPTNAQSQAVCDAEVAATGAVINGSVSVSYFNSSHSLLTYSLFSGNVSFINKGLKCFYYVYDPVLLQNVLHGVYVFYLNDGVGGISAAVTPLLSEYGGKSGEILMGALTSSSDPAAQNGLLTDLVAGGSLTPYVDSPAVATIVGGLTVDPPAASTPSGTTTTTTTTTNPDGTTTSTGVTTGTQPVDLPYVAGSFSGPLGLPLWSDVQLAYSDMISNNVLATYINALNFTIPYAGQLPVYTIDLTSAYGGQFPVDFNRFAYVFDAMRLILWIAVLFVSVRIILRS